MLVDHFLQAACAQPTKFENLEPQMNTDKNPDFTGVHPWLNALRSAHLVKHYGRRRVVDDVSLQVDRGEVDNPIEVRMTSTRSGSLAR